MSIDMPVIEIFGPTIQGEGPEAGRKTMFLRTAGCDYSCSWCDSAFTWDGSGKSMIRMMQAEQIIAELEALDPHFDYLVISGGNPLLLGDGMQQLITQLRSSRALTIGIETQGSIWKDWLLLTDHVVISPKPPSSGMTTDFDQLRQMIESITPHTGCHAYLKVVVFDEQDYQYAKSLHLQHPEIPFFISVGNTDPGEPGDISDRLLQDYSRLITRVTQDSEIRNVRVLPQLHTLVWGNKKRV